MIHQNHFLALKTILSSFIGKNIKWAFVGSFNLALQGVDVEPQDIDIITDSDGALLMNELLKEFVVTPVKYRSDEKYDAYQGIFMIAGAEVEILGQLHNKNPYGDLWTETNSLSAIKMMNYRGLKVPVIALEQEAHAYTKLGKPEKAQLIKDFLEHNPDKREDKAKGK